MPVKKDLQSLKRPDLQGHFSCGTCGQVFRHAASRNRHRRNKHSDHTCLLCNTALGENQDLHEHMKNVHNLLVVLTCGCCNYTFDKKKILIEHTKSVRLTGHLGSALPIAKSNNAPGAFLMHRYQGAELKNREGSLSSAQSSVTSTPSIRSGRSSKRVSPKPAKKELVEVDSLDGLINDAISKILASGIIYGNALTLPQTWERIYTLGREMVIEDLEKKIE